MTDDIVLTDSVPAAPAQPATEQQPPASFQPADFADTPAGPTDAESLLANATTADDMQRIAAGLRGELDRAPASVGVQEKDFPAGAGEITADPTEAKIDTSKPLPPRVRIRGLPLEHQKLIAALTDKDRPVAEILRELNLSPAAPSTQAAQEIDIPGLPTTSSTAPQPAPVPVAPPPSEAVETLKAQRQALREQRTQALLGMDAATVARLENEIDLLSERIPEAARAEVEHREHNRAVWDDSVRRGEESFPDAFTAGTPLFNECARVYNEWARTANVLANHNDRPALLAAYGAANLGIAPKPKGGTSAGPAAKPAPTASLTPRAASPSGSPPAPASGAARTAPPASVASQTDQLLNQAKDVNDVLLLSKFV